jgi:spore coat polysaccharide biosynthesis protein SpsF
MIVAIIQARMGSSRFPGKVMKEIQGKSLLALYINRVRPSTFIDKIVVATTTNPEDDIIEKGARASGVEVFRGSANDLLDRYYMCARQYGNPSAVVRLTSDDVFVDHEVLDRGISISLAEKADFVTNHFEPTYPEGLDVEIYSFECLEEAWRNAKLLSEREHVFPYIQNNPEQFTIINFRQENDYSHLRWTVDYECDYEMAKMVYDHLYQKKPIFLQAEIIELITRHPEIAAMNSHIKRKEGVNKTKAEDRVIK